MQIIEGEGFYQLIPLHAIGDIPEDQGRKLLFGTDEELLAYFEKHPNLIGYQLLKVRNCEVVNGGEY